MNKQIRWESLWFTISWIARACDSEREPRRYGKTRHWSKSHWIWIFFSSLNQTFLLRSWIGFRCLVSSTSWKRDAGCGCLAHHYRRRFKTTQVPPNMDWLASLQFYRLHHQLPVTLLDGNAEDGKMWLPEARLKLVIRTMNVPVPAFNQREFPKRGWSGCLHNWHKKLFAICWHCQAATLCWDIAYSEENYCRQMESTQRVKGRKWIEIYSSQKKSGWRRQALRCCWMVG